ncbi:aminotransferase [Pseudoscardovia suis]|uniref:Diaminopimelate aminotransferase n=2 Tax=Pseudoscardovia suis TaxID=987063 RepID=A0A261F1H4_9BIFI|nr:diaminopimelate aminotransferase [Pseudoscardovia suis]PJJ68476.1 aminotransferase [Pseudoscardovia suis]
MPRGMQGSGERRTCMTAVAQAATAKASQSQETRGHGTDLGDLLADRVAAIPANPFAKADARVAAAVANGKPVINLAKGNPDGEPPQFMQDAVAKAARESINFKYSPFDGKPEYLSAISSWYRSQHGVHIDPKTQLLAVAGASVGISVAIQALINKDDLVVLVGPYYPQYEGSTAVVQGRVHVVPTDEKHGFLPDLDAVPGAVWDEAKLLILNYPNNPTGAVATPEFFANAVRLAHEHHFVILNDFAYAGIGFDEQPPISLLETPGAIDVSIELGSLSKMYMVAGWRGGFVAGNAQLLAAIKSVHQQTSILMSSIVQVAGAAGLNSDQSTVRTLAVRYRDRYHALRDGLAQAGLRLATAHGGLFAWLAVPHGWNDEDFAVWLLDKANVAVIPGSDFGPTGAGFVRLSLLEPATTLAEAARRIAAARGNAW